LTKADYGNCDKGHPLTSIDLGLVNDLISVKFNFLMIFNYLKEKLVNSFSWNIRKESVEDIGWTLKYTKAVTKLDFKGILIAVEHAKVIGEVLKVNTTLQILNLNYN